VITRFESFVANNEPADNLCDGCGKEKKKHTISIFIVGLTGNHFLIHFCDECIAKDSIVLATISKIFGEKAQELANKGY